MKNMPASFHFVWFSFAFKKVVIQAQVIFVRLLVLDSEAMDALSKSQKGLLCREFLLLNGVDTIAWRSKMPQSTGKTV